MTAPRDAAVPTARAQRPTGRPSPMYLKGAGKARGRRRGRTGLAGEIGQDEMEPGA